MQHAPYSVPDPDEIDRWADRCATAQWRVTNAEKQRRIDEWRQYLRADLNNVHRYLREYTPARPYMQRADGTLSCDPEENDDMVHEVWDQIFCRPHEEAKPDMNKLWERFGR